MKQLAKNAIKVLSKLENPFFSIGPVPAIRRHRGRVPEDRAVPRPGLARHQGGSRQRVFYDGCSAAWCRRVGRDELLLGHGMAVGRRHGRSVDARDFAGPFWMAAQYWGLSLFDLERRSKTRSTRYARSSGSGPVRASGEYNYTQFIADDRTDLWGFRGTSPTHWTARRVRRRGHRRLPVAEGDEPDPSVLVPARCRDAPADERGGELRRRPVGADVRRGDAAP